MLENHHLIPPFVPTALCFISSICFTFLSRQKWNKWKIDLDYKFVFLVFIFTPLIHEKCQKSPISSICFRFTVEIKKNFKKIPELFQFFKPTANDFISFIGFKVWKPGKWNYWRWEQYNKSKVKVTWFTLFHFHFHQISKLSYLLSSLD